jgi:hypothetical protein
VAFARPAPSSAGVQTETSYKSAPHLCLHSVMLEELNVYFYQVKERKLQGMFKTHEQTKLQRQLKTT